MKQGAQLLLWLAIALLAALALGPWKASIEGWLAPPTVVAKINDQELTTSTLSAALREHLWRRGEHWAALSPEQQADLRHDTLERLIDQALLHQTTPSQTKVKPGDELLWFQRQLDFETGRYAAGLEGQQLTELQLRDQIQSLLQDGVSIESQLDHPVTEAQVRAWFDAHQASLVVPEVWHVQHLFLSNHEPTKPDRKSEIEELARRIASSSATFEDLIPAKSEDDRTKLHGGDLGWFTSARMPEEFIAALKPLTLGKLSAPVLSKLGWHLIRVIEHKPSRPLSFEEARSEITAMLENQRRGLTLNQLIAERRSKAHIEHFNEVINATIPPLE